MKRKLWHVEVDAAKALCARAHRWLKRPLSDLSEDEHVMAYALYMQVTVGDYSTTEVSPRWLDFEARAKANGWPASTSCIAWEKEKEEKDEMDTTDPLTLFQTLIGLE